MAYPVKDVVIKQAGDGVKKDFEFDCRIYEKTDINVYDGVIATGVAGDKLVLYTDYDVEIYTDRDGGKVTYVNAPALGNQSIIESALPISSRLVLKYRTKFSDEQIEEAMTRLTIQNQQQKASLDRCLKVGIGEATDPDTYLADLFTAISEASGGANALAAEAARDAALVAQANAEAAETNSEIARGLAETAQGLAEAAQAAAEAAAGGVPTMATILASVMPVGFVVTLGVSTNPATLYGFGTWSAIAGRVVVGINAGDTEFDTLNETGGAKTHTLTVNEIPAHDHRLASISTFNETCAGFGESRVNGVGGPLDGDPKSVSFYSTDGRGHDLMENTGGGLAHNNLQPYIVKYIWERTA